MAKENNLDTMLMYNSYKCGSYNRGLYKILSLSFKRNFGGLLLCNSNYILKFDD